MNRNNDSETGKKGSERLTAGKSIRSFCIECAGGLMVEVKLCPVESCPLWQWRFGKRPETVEKKNPVLLDAEYIRREGEKRAQQGK